MDMIENQTYDEITVGQTASIERKLTQSDIQLFAYVSGDVNPAHLDEEYAASSMFQEVIAHGMWGGSLISSVLGTELPGPGTIYLGQTLKFSRPVHLGDVLTVTVTVLEKGDKNRVKLECVCTNQDGDSVMKGTADVLAPTKKVSRPRAELPEVRLRDRRAQIKAVLNNAKGIPAQRTAVVHPVTANAIQQLHEAAQNELIIPVLVGPADKINIAAAEASIDVSNYEIVNTEHSHQAAKEAVKLARSGSVNVIMRGSLHADELMHAVLDHNNGLRTDRRASHVSVMDVPAYPKPLLITDAAVNISPTMEEKRDIVQNAIDLAHIMGNKKPKVALLSAVETVTPNMQSTIDAASLCKMADRGQITGGELDGPLAFDNAISLEAARTKGIESNVAGQADILVAPDIEAGNMLTKQLAHFGDALFGGIIMGTRVPIVLTGRADGAIAGLTSCALAAMVAKTIRPE